VVKNLSFKIRSLVIVGGTILIIILLNFILSKRFLRWDITADQRYTLKDATTSLLKNDERFNAPVYVKIYFTGDFPPESELKELQELGLREMVITDFSESSGQLARTIPGAVISYPDKPDIAINFVPVRAAQQIMELQDKFSLLNLLDESQIELEYKLTSAISQITLRDRPNIGFLQGHRELDEDHIFMAKEALKEYYDVGDVDILKVVDDSSSSLSVQEQVLSSLSPFDVLIIAKPQEDFKEIEKVVIDQYIMKGGKVIWSIDMMADMRDTLFYYGGTSFYAHENKLNLENMLFKYGVRVEPTLIFETSEHRAPSHYPKFKDLGNGLEPVYLVTDWSYYPLVTDYTQKRDGSGSSKAHMITEGVPRVKLEYASHLTVLNRKDNVKKTVLLETSDTTYYRAGAVDVSYDLMREQLINSQKFGLPFKQYLPTAVLLEGKFESLYKNRLLPKSMGGALNIIEKSSPTSMIVISDGDIFKNDIDSLSTPGLKRKVKLTHSIYSMSNRKLNFYYGNRDFLMNSVEYLLGENTILSVRRKFIPNRLDRAKVEVQRSKWKFLNVTLPILIIIVFGLGQFLYRRKKYAS